MPSSEDCISAKQQVKEWAIESLIKQGHAPHSARAIANNMDYDKQIEEAEKIRGEIYRGAYSPY